MWIAGLLGFFFSPLAMLYVSKRLYALIYLLVGLVVGVLVNLIFNKSENVFLLILNYAFPVIAMIHAMVLSKQNINTRQWYSKWYGLIIIFMIFIIPILIIRIFYFEPFYIPSESMRPTLKVGNTIVIKKYGCGNYRLYGYTIFKTKRTNVCQINRGDVVVMQYPPEPSVAYVERVVGIGGDVVSYKNKVLVVNGKIVENSIINDGISEAVLLESIGGINHQIIHMQHRKVRDGEWTVPLDSYFVLGDNRDNSADSRVWGYVPEQNIIGKLYYIFK